MKGDGKSWKKIVSGQAHGTTAGHKFRSYREAIKKAKSGKYKKVYLNTGYNKVTGKKISPNRRPDVTGVRKTGQIDTIEVPQKTDLRSDLIQRNQEAMQKLPQEMRGRIDIAEIK